MEDVIKEEWECEDHSPSYESDDKLGWMWRKGLSLGKKMAVAGVVITSTPLVFPSLVALSTVGLAISLPAGFAVVTYVCAEKVVNSLLPPASPTSSLDDGTDDWFSGDAGYTYSQADDYGPISFHKDESSSGTMVSEITEESVDMECGEQGLTSDAIPDILRGIREAEEEIMSSRKREGGDELPRDSVEAVVVAADLGGENEDEVLEEEVAYVAPREDKGKKSSGPDSSGQATDESKSEAKSSAGEETGGSKKKGSKKRSKKDKSGGSIQEEQKLMAERRLEVHGKMHGGQNPSDAHQEAGSGGRRGGSNTSDSSERGDHVHDHGTVAPERASNVEGKGPSSKNEGVNAGHHQASVGTRKPVTKDPKSKADHCSSTSSSKVKGGTR